MIAAFPLQVLDRELDMGIVNSLLLALKGHTCLIGDENNIAPILLDSQSLNVIKHASPTANPQRRLWNERVIENGGLNIGCNLEGCNNSPFHIHSVDSHIELRPRPTPPMTGDLNLDMFINQMSFMTYQSVYSKEYERLCLPFLRNLPPSLSIVTGDPRDILTTNLGALYFKNRSDSIKTLLGSPFVLVPDNFNVDSFGMHKKGTRDPSNDYLKAGNSKEDVHSFMEDRERLLEREEIARNRFAQVIVSLAKALPHIPFVIRPHPVLDATFWYHKFSSFRNVIVLYRDSIYPWLHSACAVIHSGCTTGYEAARTGTPVFDIGHLIDHTKPSLSSYCSFKPDSLKDLAQQLTSHFANDHPSEIDSAPSSLIDSHIYNLSIPPASSLISSFNPFLQTSSSYISNKVSNILNADDIFANNIFYHVIDSSIATTKFSSLELFQSNITKFTGLTGNFPPVYLKSRSLSATDVRNRYLSALHTFSLHHHYKLLFQQVASNTFLFALHPINASRISSRSSYNSLKTPSFPHTYSKSVALRESSSRQLEAVTRSSWPATDPIAHLKMSIKIQNLTESFLNSYSCKSSNPRDLSNLKNSDTVFILGSGPSINTLSSKEIDFISSHDTIGINNFIVHKLDSTFSIYEASTDYHLEFITKIRSLKGCHTPLLLNGRHLSTAQNKLLNFLNTANNIHFLNPLAIKPFHPNLFSQILSALSKNPLKPTFHARGSLSIAYSLACSLGYKNVIFVGVELNSNNYFFQDPSFSTFKPDSVIPILDDLMDSEQAFASKLYNLDNPLYNDKHKHFTVSDRISRTLDITKIISISSQYYKKTYGTNTYLFHSSGLLSPFFKTIKLK